MSEVRGLVEYPVTEQPTQLFPGLSNGMTLYVTAGSSRIWVGTTAAVKTGVGLPMNPLASIAWDRDKPMYACTEGAGLTATIVGLDLQASVNDPTLLASLISGGTVDATAIATAIATSGLTPAGIAGAILAGGLTAANIAAAIAASGLTAVDIGDEVGLSVPSAAAIGAAVGGAVPSAVSIGAAVAAPTGGTPVLLQLRSLATAAGVTRNGFSDVWQGGAHQGGPWSVPAGKRLVVTDVNVQAVAGAAARGGLVQLCDGGSAGTAGIYHSTPVRVDASTSRGVVQPITPGTVVIPAGIEPQVRDDTGAAGLTVDVAVSGVLF